MPSPWHELALAAIAGLGIGVGLFTAAAVARYLLRRTDPEPRHLDRRKDDLP